MIELKRTGETMIFNQGILAGEVSEAPEKDQKNYRDDAIRLIDRLSKNLNPLGIEWTLVEALKLLQADYAGKHNGRDPVPTVEEVDAKLVRRATAEPTGRPENP